MSTPTIKLRPAPGVVVRDPTTRRVLKADGEEKPRNQYWMRRLAASEVVEIKPPAEKPFVVTNEVESRAKKSTVVAKKEGES